ncbi:MurR/RpiR family transcriptional regulator [Clostridium sp.]|uniref:MurR/RpiR family transcriptional regulator n=1 Tax=Clostridium sp. TaxID=1506 RepID=UPI00260F29B0|nr:MurR/RpiR family transcriptional regulator [Clostridium sp.]
MGDLIYRLLLFLNSSKSNDINYNIALTMLKNIKSISDMSINKLADICYTSPAAITRFCHKLGYSNFIQFKENIKTYIDHYSIGLMKPNAISYDLSREAMLSNMASEIIMEVEGLKNFLDLKIVDRVVELIYSHSNVCLFGTQFAQLMAQELQRKLANLSKITYHRSDVQEQERLADNLDENSLVILLSPTGQFTLYHERLWTKIKKSPATVVVITDNNKPEYEKRSDYIIYLPNYSTNEDYIQRHRYDLSYLVEYIYLRYGNLYCKNT